jgi:hypothetical protein
MKYVPGLMVGQLSGKAGSTVASRNKSGSYFRTRVIPKLVQNGKTTAVRSNFAYNSETYRTITPAQQQGWIALGAQIKKKNSIGVAYTLTGLQAFQSVNRVLSTLGLAAVVASPTLAQPEALTSLSATVNGQYGSRRHTLIQRRSCDRDCRLGRQLDLRDANRERDNHHRVERRDHKDSRDQPRLRAKPHRQRQLRHGLCDQAAQRRRDPPGQTSLSAHHSEQRKRCNPTLDRRRLRRRPRFVPRRRQHLFRGKDR